MTSLKHWHLRSRTFKDVWSTSLNVKRLRLALPSFRNCDYQAKMERYFKILDQELFCEKINLKKVLEICEQKFKVPTTPLFVYSKAQLTANIKTYQDALRQLACQTQLNYAVKANPNLTLVKTIQSLGVSATLISGNEIRLALEAGFEPSRLMYNGGGKYTWETRLAIEHNLLINVDSEWDLRQTIDICQNGFSEPRKARVLLRLNLNIDPAVHKFVNTGTADSKFGLDDEESEKCLQLLQQPDCPTELVGLHSHLGSTIYHSDVFRVSVEKLLECRTKLLQRGFGNVNIINIGGGLGIDYKYLECETRPWRCESETNQARLITLRDLLLKARVEGVDSEEQKSIHEMTNSIISYIAESISLADLKQASKEFLKNCPSWTTKLEENSLTTTKPKHATPYDLMNSIQDLLSDKTLQLILEPGRSLVANTCVVISRVMGCKKTSQKKFVIIDAAMTEIIRPCLYGAYHHVSVLQDLASSQVSKAVYDVVGPVCESSDFIAKDRLLPNPENGLVVIHDVGAYCYSMASNYNIRMRPAEVMVTVEKCDLIRRPDTYDEFMTPYRI
ncbi:unnamed protein product [Lymnaea stagnalis]|uniref:Orn/DAP/Arg decarboxylase 2 N-terminal domain-containing protein n=1 Tax=Lymnaea stagnalis TaxID=6523 RepID=A0AAV2H155_LYMST